MSDCTADDQPSRHDTRAVAAAHDLAWALLNASNELAVLVDLKGNILALNENMARSLGRPVGEVVGVNVADLLPEPVARLRLQQGLEVVRSGQMLRFEDQRDGRHFLNSMSPIFGPDGSVVQVAAFAREITDLRRAEHEHRLASLGSLSAGVAHEFNNLMGALLLAARMVEDPAAHPDLRNLVDLVVRSTTSGRDICRNLLAFARPPRTEWQTMPIEAPVEAALSLTMPHLEQSRVILRRVFASGDCAVRGDATQLGHLFLNLLLNACQAMADGGTLVVTTRALVAEDGTRRAVVTVSDTGRGIPPEDLPHVFEPFFTRGKGDSAERPGTGLGLSVTYGTAEHHGGTIEVHSEAGVGTTFTVSLPAATATAPPGAPLAAPISPPGRLGREARVLVAEDQQDMLRLLQRLLVAEGCHVVVTPRTHDALDALRTETFDLVISDYRMPDGGAPLLLEAARALSVPPPVLIITGSADPEAAASLLAQGAAACLLKPFERSDLQRLLVELLEAGAAPTG